MIVKNSRPSARSVACLAVLGKRARLNAAGAKGYRLAGITRGCVESNASALTSLSKVNEAW